MKSIDYGIDIAGVGGAERELDYTGHRVHGAQLGDC